MLFHCLLFLCSPSFKNNLEREQFSLELINLNMKTKKFFFKQEDLKPSIPLNSVKSIAVFSSSERPEILRHRAGEAKSELEFHLVFFKNYKIFFSVSLKKEGEEYFIDEKIRGEIKNKRPFFVLFMDDDKKRYYYFQITKIDFQSSDRAILLGEEIIYRDFFE